MCQNLQQGLLQIRERIDAGKMVKWKKFLSGKATSIMLFSYGAIVGTSAPLLLSRCGTNCSSCAGYCGVALGILPLVGFVVVKSRIKRSGKQVASSLNQDEG